MDVKVTFQPLTANGHFMYQLGGCSYILYFASTIYLCVICESRNKQLHIWCMEQLSDWFVERRLRVTKYHITNRHTNCMSFILNHFFKTLIAPICFDSISLIIIREHIPSSQLKSRVKNMNFFVIILLWQHILYLCTLFLVQRGKWTCLPARETTYTNTGYAATTIL